MSCTSTRVPAGAPSTARDRTETSSGPSGLWSSCPEGLEYGSGRGAGVSLGHGRGRGGLAEAHGAEPHGVEALVLGDPGEKLEQPGAVAGADQIPQGLLDGTGDERGAEVQIPLEPLQGELVDQRDHRVGEGTEREEQRNDEPQRKPHGSLWKIIAGSCTLDVHEP